MILEPPGRPWKALEGLALCFTLCSLASSRLLVTRAHAPTVPVGGCSLLVACMNKTRVLQLQQAGSLWLFADWRFSCRTSADRLVILGCVHVRACDV